MKKFFKIAGIVILIALSAGLLWFGNAMFGNPIPTHWQRKLQKHSCQTDFLIQIIRWNGSPTASKMVSIMRL